MQAAIQTRRSPWIILLVLCLGFFMILLDLTIVNVAIPSIIDGLHAGLDEILWVLNAYILVYAVLLITAGRLGDKYGAKRLFLIGLAVFSLASIGSSAESWPARSRPRDPGHRWRHSHSADAQHPDQPLSPQPPRRGGWGLGWGRLCRVRHRPDTGRLPRDQLQLAGGLLGQRPGGDRRLHPRRLAAAG